MLLFDIGHQWLLHLATDGLLNINQNRVFASALVVRCRFGIQIDSSASWGLLLLKRIVSVL